MVPSPARRQPEVRREPAQALPGHLQRRPGLRGLAQPVGRAARRAGALDRARRERVPRRQPAHQADRLLGVAHRRRARAPPAGRLPGRGLHHPGAHGHAGQGRLQPELHLLHLEEHALGARGLPDRAGGRRSGRSAAAQLLRQHPGHPARLPAAGRARRRSRPGWCWPPPSRRATASTRASSTPRTSRCGRAARSTSTRRSTRSAPATWTGRCCRSPARSTASAASARRCSGCARCASWRRSTRASSPTPGAAGRTWSSAASTSTRTAPARAWSTCRPTWDCRRSSPSSTC